MNQLFTAFGIDWRLLIIQGVNFGLLLFVLSRYLYKPMMKMIDERREKIAEGVRMAEGASQRLSDAEQEGRDMVGTAARDAEALIASARARGSEKEVEMLRIAESKVDTVMKDAALRSEEIKRQAMLESERGIARAAMLAAEKILRTKTI